MHADGPRAVGPHGKPVEASAGTTASDVGAMRGSSSNNLKERVLWDQFARDGARRRMHAAHARRAVARGAAPLRNGARRSGGTPCMA